MALHPHLQETTSTTFIWRAMTPAPTSKAEANPQSLQNCHHHHPKPQPQSPNHTNTRSTPPHQPRSHPTPTTTQPSLQALAKLILTACSMSSIPRQDPNLSRSHPHLQTGTKIKHHPLWQNRTNLWDTPNSLPSISATTQDGPETTGLPTPCL